MSERNIADLREDYLGEPLDEATVAASPVEQFHRWFTEVLDIALPLANGMTLATTDPEGRPTARVVLLKGYDDDGFTFFTNYHSRKGRELEASGRAALLFWWVPLHRQVRIEGPVERVSEAESDAYFATRPRESNLSAMASPQSRVVAGRGWLMDRAMEARQEWAGKDLVRPPQWGGYRVVPRWFEFWQGRGDRMHDRLSYRLVGDAWVIERLAP